MGNDVLDLQHPRCRHREKGDRLPFRILTEAEMEWWRAAGESGPRLRRLWALWAAKETTFKAVSKIEGQPPVFRHREFEASLRERIDGEVVRLEGTVVWRSHRCSVEGISTPRFLHMVGWLPYPGHGQATGGSVGSSTLSPAGREAPLLEVGIEGCSEGSGAAAGRWRGAGAALSRRVRELAAQRLASHLRRTGVPVDSLGSEVPRIRIGRSLEGGIRRPPTVWVNDRACREVDLSLSHHGRYVAWVLSLPECRGGPSDPEPASD